MRKVTKKWTTKNGTKIRICDMGDSHLINSIKMLKRYAQCIQIEYPWPNFRGEMAQYYAEQEYDIITTSPPEKLIPILEDLMRDAERRNIDD